MLQMQDAPLPHSSAAAPNAHTPGKNGPRMARACSLVCVRIQSFFWDSEVSNHRFDWCLQHLQLTSARITIYQNLESTVPSGSLTPRAKASPSSFIAQSQKGYKLTQAWWVHCIISIQNQHTSVNFQRTSYSHTCRPHWNQLYDL
jgi:hypothetical protein